MRRHIVQETNVVIFHWSTRDFQYVVHTSLANLFFEVNSLANLQPLILHGNENEMLQKFWIVPATSKHHPSAQFCLIWPSRSFSCMNSHQALGLINTRYINTTASRGMDSSARCCTENHLCPQAAGCSSCSSCCQNGCACCSLNHLAASVVFYWSYCCHHRRRRIQHHP